MVVHICNRTCMKAENTPAVSWCLVPECLLHGYVADLASCNSSVGSREHDVKLLTTSYTPKAPEASSSSSTEQLSTSLE